jgi:hypothetical protein
LVYVSVTGLRLVSVFRYPVFVWHAVGAMIQARRADGCLSADARSIAGWQHTLTVWRDRKAMLAFVASGAHLKAMRAFRLIGTGRTIGFEAARAPGWDEALSIWRERAREIGPAGTPAPSRPGL